MAWVAGGGCNLHPLKGILILMIKGERGGNGRFERVFKLLEIAHKSCFMAGVALNKHHRLKSEAVLIVNCKVTAVLR